VPSLRLLLLEDNPNDAELVQTLLEESGLACDVTLVQTRDAFLAALRVPEIELILADYHLPAFDGFSALLIAREQRPEVPFIFVSGTLGEELAVDALKIGATDYVLKTRLSRLVPSVVRALREAREHLERTRAEDALRRSEMYLASLLELTHDAIFVRDMQGRITYWNRGAESLYGWSTGEATGQLASELMNTVSAIPLEHIVEILYDSGRWEGELERATKNGSLVTVASRWSLQLDAHGVPVAILETNNDVTQRKLAEQERERLRQLEADLAYINRVSMMGEMAASLAHEVKQPMAAAAMNASACRQWLRRDVPDIAQADDAAGAANVALKRAIDIINGVYSLYSQGAPVRQCVNVNDIIRDMTFLLRETASRNGIAIRAELAPAPGKVRADPVQLQQVLLNLILNAIEAMREGGGEIVISSAAAGPGELTISVIDSGVGLPPGVGERVFDAFFTTKTHGTGMGLCICQRIVEAHGGRLVALPNNGRGAIFRFTLPVEEVVPLA
jgi:PAS domain S-box-containing protein